LLKQSRNRSRFDESLSEPALKRCLIQVIPKQGIEKAIPDSYYVIGRYLLENRGQAVQTERMSDFGKVHSDEEKLKASTFEAR